MEFPVWVEYWEEIPGQFAYSYIPETGQLFTRPIPVCGGIKVDFAGDLSFTLDKNRVIDITIPDTVGTIREVIDLINNSTDWKCHFV